MEVTLGDRPVTRIGLGTNRLAHSDENVAFVQAAVAAGVGMVDTAHVYSGGESEAAIGEVLASSSERCLVATKGGYNDGRPEAISAQIEESLHRLRTSTIDLYYLHKPDPQVPLADSLGAIEEARQRGAIRYVGVSNVSLEEVGLARGVTPITAVQNHYNLAHRAGEDIIDYCAEKGIVFVPYFPLRDDGGAAAAQIAERRGATPAQIVLAWLLRRSPAMLPIPGTLSLQHVNENLAALQIELSDDEFEALR